MAQNKLEVTGHYVMVDGLRVHYDEYGEGIPLICIHSAGACSLVFYDFLLVMAKNGFRAIAPNLPGHGMTYAFNWQPFRVMREYGEFTWKIIQAICPGEKPVITGCAVGGDLVIDIAAHHSEDLRAVISMEGAAHTPTFTSPFIYEDPHACPGWRNITERSATSALYRPLSKEKETELRWIHRFNPQEVAVADLECWCNHDVRDKMKDVKCPLLALAGEADHYVPEYLLDDTIKDIPNGLGEKTIAKKMGHYAPFEQPESLGDIFMDFLKRHKVI